MIWSTTLGSLPLVLGTVTGGIPLTESLTNPRLFAVDPTASPLSAQTISTEQWEQSVLQPMRLSTPPATLVAPYLAQSTLPNPDKSITPTRPDLQPLPVVPPAPTPPSPLEIKPETPAPEQPAVPDATVEVKQIQILGNTVFSQAELDRAIAPFIGKNLTFEQLLSIRTVITELYTREGYVTSGAFLPPQDISSGVIKVQVVEGELEKVEIRGLRRLRESYVRNRINQAADRPLDIRKLERALQLLQIDPLFDSIQAELNAGTAPGQNILVLNLKEAKALHLITTVDNWSSPTVGEIRGSLNVIHQNLLGFGDRAAVQIAYTAGVSDYAFDYQVPLTPKDGTLIFRYANNSSQVIEQFRELDIRGRSQTFSLGYRQPVIRTPTTEFALGLSLDVRRSRTFLGDIGFGFSPGVSEDGKSRVTVLRFSQDWINRSPNRVLAARSQFSFGLDALGATINDTGTDGRFLSWVGQFQWVQNLGGNITSVARVATQLTGDSLLPLEQFSIGGVDTVRGYRQNQQVADSGVIASFEVRVPMTRQKKFGDIDLVPFVEMGHVWNNRTALLDPTTLASVGLGVRWQIAPYWSARLDWGLPIISAGGDFGNNLQESGIFFSFSGQPF
jgi:hemolysin activation/secretion protein